MFAAGFSTSRSDRVSGGLSRGRSTIWSLSLTFVVTAAVMLLILQIVAPSRARAEEVALIITIQGNRDLQGQSETNAKFFAERFRGKRVETIETPRGFGSLPAEQYLSRALANRLQEGDQITDIIFSAHAGPGDVFEEVNGIIRFRGFFFSPLGERPKNDEDEDNIFEDPMGDPLGLAQEAYHPWFEKLRGKVAQELTVLIESCSTACRDSTQAKKFETLQKLFGTLGARSVVIFASTTSINFFEAIADLKPLRADQAGFWKRIADNVLALARAGNKGNLIYVQDGQITDVEPVDIWKSDIRGVFPRKIGGTEGSATCESSFLEE